MIDVVKWLKEIEHQAHEIYEQAALIYSDDPEFKKFLEHLAEDEAWHYHVMGSAADYLASENAVISKISIDKETNQRVNAYLKDIKDGLGARKFSKSEFLEKIVELEHSEWNDIFLYIVNTLKEKTSHFKYPAAKLQSHLKEIENYVSQFESLSRLLQEIKQLPSVWTENILLVDDDELITELMKKLFKGYGNIDVAYNGKEALDMIMEKYYKLIVTDVDMPVMDGMTFYKETISNFPSSNKRFIFVTGDVSPEKQNFFEQNNVKYLPKPMEIKSLKAAASEIIKTV